MMKQYIIVRSRFWYSRAKIYDAITIIYIYIIFQSHLRYTKYENAAPKTSVLEYG